MYAGTTVLQYWFFYDDDFWSLTYPPGSFAWQAHEGDWEAVTVVLDAEHDRRIRLLEEAARGVQPGCPVLLLQQPVDEGADRLRELASGLSTPSRLVRRPPRRQPNDNRAERQLRVLRCPVGEPEDRVAHAASRAHAQHRRVAFLVVRAPHDAHLRLDHQQRVFPDDVAVALGHVAAGDRIVRAVDEKVDPASLEAGFVKIAKSYSNRKGISYTAWRAVGVQPNVLKKAGIPRSS